MDKQREAFEAWVMKHGNYPRRPELKAADCSYHYIHIEGEWRAWQAAQAVQPGWRTIESAPKDGTEIFLGCKDGSMTCATYSKRDKRWHGDIHDPCEWATHWMPLPAAPSTKEKAE